MDSSTRLRTEVIRLRESNARLNRLIKKLKESNRVALHLNKKMSNLALKDLIQDFTIVVTLKIHWRKSLR